MVLILSQFDDDPSVERIAQLLHALGREVVVIGPGTVAGPSGLFVEPDRCRLRIPGHDIDLSRVSAAWLWRAWTPNPLEPRHRELARRREEWQFYVGEWNRFHKSFTMLLGQLGVFCVNPPPWNAAFEEKCCALWLATDCGLRIPPSLFTAHLPTAAGFHGVHADSTIYKPFGSFLRIRDPVGGGDEVEVERLLTNRVCRADLVEREDSLPTPGIFQPYVDKRVELRITVVGRQVLACAIHSQGSPRSREDWRRYDLDRTPYVPFTLPEEIGNALLRLMERMHLNFGCIDMIVTPDGEYVFLEVNPNGQFDFVARLAGLPIHEHLASMLAAASIDYLVEDELIASCSSH